MTKTINLKPQTFIKTKFFPGCAGNPFDRILHSLEKLENIPPLILFIFFIFLALLGGLPYYLKYDTIPLITGFLAMFFFLDYILLSLLPVTRQSFGPPKVVTLMLSSLRVPFAWLPDGWNLGFEIAGTLLVIYGFYIEPLWVEVHHETYTSKKLTCDQPLRVLHISDLHIERLTRREKKIIDKVKQLSPDLILFTGDLLNLSYLNDFTAQSDAISFFNQLSAPLGVYGVTGSPAVDDPVFFARLSKSTSLQWLNNESIVLDTPSGLTKLLGVTCTHNPDLDEKALSDLLNHQQTQEEAINILLYHSPDLSLNSSQLGVDLQLSGHTHGGQVRLPIFGALFTGSLYGKTFEAGRYLVNGMTLYISRGLGLEGAIAPRVRFLCRPELILWELTNNFSKPR
jgi:predicted MPP superfamily phosphohydrolase